MGEYLKQLARSLMSMVCVFALAGTAQATVWKMDEVLQGSTGIISVSVFRAAGIASILGGSILGTIDPSVTGTYDDMTGEFSGNFFVEEVGVGPVYFTLQGTFLFNNPEDPFLIDSFAQLDLVDLDSSGDKITDTTLTTPQSGLSFLTSFDSTTGIMTIVGANGFLTEFQFYFDTDLGMQLQIQLSQVVDIDIKPGSDPSCFNIDGHGVIPVAILGSDQLNVSNIDPTTLLFDGLAVRVRGKKWPLCSIEDSNGDPFPDLVCHFEDDASSWTGGNATATVTGELFDGPPIVGTDSICIVP